MEYSHSTGCSLAVHVAMLRRRPFVPFRFSTNGPQNSVTLRCRCREFAGNVSAPLVRRRHWINIYIQGLIILPVVVAREHSAAKMTYKSICNRRLTHTDVRTAAKPSLVVAVSSNISSPWHTCTCVTFAEDNFEAHRHCVSISGHLHTYSSAQM